MKKFFSLSLLLLLLLIVVDERCHQMHSGFCAEKVLSFSSPRQEWELPPIDSLVKERAQEILSQEFSYLAKGSQSYAFLSHDGKYVLKFFKQHKLRPQTYLAKMLHLSQEKFRFRQNKFSIALQSCKRAFTQFKEETGMIYLHLNRGCDLERTVSLIDSRGKKIELDIDATAFILQEKADLIYPTLNRLMEAQKREEAEKTISAIFSLLHTFGERGVYGNDFVVRKNIGIVHDKVVQIDVGKFYIDPSHPFREDIADTLRNFRAWLDQNHPSLLTHFDTELQKAVSTL